jgi:hypothetical protein
LVVAAGELLAMVSCRERERKARGERGELLGGVVKSRGAGEFI